MEERLDRVVSPPRELGSAEERMLRGIWCGRLSHGKSVAKGSSGSRANSG